MPPLRNRSQAGAIVNKKVHRKARPQQEPSDSWELLDRQGLGSTVEETDMNGGDYRGSFAVQVLPDVEDAVNPLREMAEKVGREVDLFAEKVDQFFEELPQVASRFDAAHDLILSFKNIADGAVKDLKQKHEREVREQLKKEWSEQARIGPTSPGLQPFISSGSSSLNSKKALQVKQLRLWQQEADIWELFRMMLELHPFEAEAQAMRTEREEKLAKLGAPHRYTSEGDLWERFLLEDDLARERYMIKTWLEQTADHQSTDLQGVAEELEAKAGRGKGLWSSGWMHTREKIKGEKRLRNWPNAVDSPLPQIRRSDNNELLATTLDPDAPSRQQRTLEKPDLYLERVLWVACWEMLRRGKSFHEMCDWCEERQEGWRAVCMGKASDDMEPPTSISAWRRICEQSSEAKSSTEYEAAVFGLLGGNIKAMEKVCRTIDDHLYAYYSATLLHQFEHYILSTCPDKAAPLAWRRNLVHASELDPAQAQQAINNLIIRLRQKPATSSEATQPMKIIQSFVLADEVGSLIHTLGAAIAENETLRGSEDDMFFRNSQSAVSGRAPDEMEVAAEPQTLRIATHMALIHRILSPEYLQGDELREDENVLVAYIQSLRAAGKRFLIPTYAAQLSRERYIRALGRTLQDITNSHEQTKMIRILQDTDLDLVAILQAQLTAIMADSAADERAQDRFVILEPSTNVDLHPGQQIRAGFLPSVYTNVDESIVSSLHWFELLKGGWDVTFQALTFALRKRLANGRFAGARMIVSTFPFDKISRSKAFETLGRAVNIMDEDAFTPHSDEEALLWDLMLKQSRTYFEMEQLVRAVENLATWREEEKICEDAGKAPERDQRLNVDEALKFLKASMEPLLRGILLNPVDEEEAEDLKKIRVRYLPEIIIAYNCVLFAAGGLVSRENLLDSMDLSTVIANGRLRNDAEESNGLLDCFVEAGRMRELVNSFALTSRAMLVMKASGKAWKPKKNRAGRDLGIWEIGGTA